MKSARREVRDRGVRIWVDLEATRRLYAVIERPASERCECVECQGFVANRGLLLPQTFVALLRKLNVDVTNESELWAVAGARDFYVSGRFDFIGKILTPSRTVSFPSRENFVYTFTNDAGIRCRTIAQQLGLGSVAAVRFAATIEVAVHPAYLKAVSE